MIIVSACLLGENCKYSGGNNKNQEVINFLRDKQYIAICPEVMGGLSTPRPPSEIIKDKVMTKTGIDVTLEFIQGAEKSLKLCLENKITLAILKANSPSCSSNTIYDGSFSGTLIKGNGITTALLLKNNITVVDENNLYNIRENVCKH